jgi:DNA repair photolyase
MELVGIAKLAAESPLLEAKRRVEYFELPSRTFIGRCSSERMPFQYTINPYRGCEFGCQYCYARYTHEFMEMRESRQFEERIFAKRWDEPKFRAELRRLPAGTNIALGTATDPYQPAERRHGVTRHMLEVFAGERSRSLWITTKSDLVTRDLDLLRTIAEQNEICVNMTVTTLDEALARLLEPYAPRPSLRISAISKLTEAGVRCGILCCPIMPLINDSERNLDSVARAGAAAGASWMHGNVLFLKPCAAQVFLPFVEERFPRLARRYRERYGNTPYLRGEYPKLIAVRMREIRQRHGLNRRSELVSSAPIPAADANPQQLLDIFSAQANTFVKAIERDPEQLQ